MNVLSTQSRHKVSVDAERGLLCAMFLSTDALVAAMDLVSAQMFYDMRHRLIFNAMISVYRDGLDVDLVSVGDELGASLESVGGSRYLADLLNACSTTALIKTHARIISDKFKLRKYQAWCNQITELVAKETEPEAARRAIEIGAISVSEMVSREKKPDPESILSELHRKWAGMKTGDIRIIPADRNLFCRRLPGDNHVTEFLPCFMPEQLIAIGGWTSNGKSTFCAELNKMVGRAGGRQLIFSTEDTRGGKLLQLIGNMIDWPKKALALGKYPKKEFDSATEEVKSWPLEIYDNVRTIEEIRLKIMKAKMRDRVDVVFLDYVQLLRGNGKIYDLMSHAAQVMQEIAIDLGVCFIFFSQIDNQSFRDKAAYMGLKGAGELSACSDIKIVLSKDNQGKEGHERDLKAVFEKNKAFGPTRTLEWQFSARWTGIESRGHYPGRTYE